jgi:hypothetical protein
LVASKAGFLLIPSFVAKKTNMKKKEETVFSFFFYVDKLYTPLLNLYSLEDKKKNACA